MITTTTPTIEGHPIKEYRGLVTGVTIIGANAWKDLKASFRDFFGGRSHSYEKVMTQARETAMKEMCEEAVKLGCNAVVSIDMDYETIGESNSILMVSVNGTAVVI